MSTTTQSAEIAYAMSDLAPTPDGRLPAGVVSLPEDKGCGRQHTAQVDGEGHVYVRCPVCAPWLTGHVYGFAATPAGVPLTPDEMGEVEISKRQGEVSYQLAMKQLGQTMGQIIQSGNVAGAPQIPAPAGPPALSPSTLKAQLATMTAAERAEIAAMLAPATADDAPAEPVKRKPGRPRTRPLPE